MADIPNQCRRYPLDALSIALAFGLAAAPALAQLQLPGALGQPAPAGTVAPPPEAPKERPKPPILHAPSEDAADGGDANRGAIGTAARKELQRELGTRVHLDLAVRVRRGWRGDERALDRLGIE